MKATPALYDVEIRHVRRDPVQHEVRRRSQLWYVDLDELPNLGPLARFRARDHVGDPGSSIRENIEDFLATNGIRLDGGRITMLTNARSLGYVFNPLTVYWCHLPDGALACVVAEVHNTYRQRHRYLLRPDDAGCAETAKAFYVSPFNPVDGYYRISVPKPDQRVAISVVLHRPSGRPFVATVSGVRRPVSARAILRRAFESWVIRGQITRHGIALLRKGLQLQPRPRPVVDSEAAVPNRPTPAARIAATFSDVAGIEIPVRVRAWDGSEAGPANAPVLVLRTRRTLRHVLWAPGELGLARAFVSGDMAVEGDLTDALRRVWAAARTRPDAGIRRGAAVPAKVLRAALALGAVGPPPNRPAVEARLTGRRHTQRRDRAAIAHHYDLSNDFYQLLLDQTMAYSCAYYTEPDQSLADAQRAKLDLVCRKLELRAGMRLLDVGCGWGSLILHAAENYGVHATGITLSTEQRDFVLKRIADRGLDDLVDVRVQDYRDLADSAERFDAVASIEMGEHVGELHYPTYLRILRTALRPTGRLVLQQMSRRHDAQPGGGPFIEGYVAPDMHMRPMSETIRHLERAGFEVCDVEGMRAHYVQTVRAWLDRFEASRDEFIRLKGEETARVWRLYLAGGGLAFEEGRMGVDQFLAICA